MMTHDIVLLDVPLVPDPDTHEEMGQSDVGVIADQELNECRLLITRRSVNGIEINGAPGGLLKLGCSFQSTHGIRFAWARFVLTIEAPGNTVIVDIAPATKLDERAV